MGIEHRVTETQRINLLRDSVTLCSIIDLSIERLNYTVPFCEKAKQQLHLQKKERRERNEVYL